MPTFLTTDWRACIDYRRPNAVTRNGHFPLPFIDQLLERVSEHPFCCFLCNTPKYTLTVFDMFRVFCKPNLNVS